MSIDVTTLAVSKNYTDKQIEKASIKGVDLSGYVQSINGVKPDKNGNVEIYILTDEYTGQKYKLAVMNGKLTMTEVE